MLGEEAFLTPLSTFRIARRKSQVCRGGFKDFKKFFLQIGGGIVIYIAGVGRPECEFPCLLIRFLTLHQFYQMF